MLKACNGNYAKKSNGYHAIRKIKITSRRILNIKSTK